MHHRRKSATAFQIWRCDVHLRTDHAAGINQLLNFQVGIRNHAAGGANRGHTKREIESREAAPHVRVHRRRPALRKEHVIMHAHQTGQDRVAFEIEYLGARRNIRSCARADRLDLAVSDNDGLIVARRGAGSIDHAHMGQRNHRSFNPDELLAVRRGRLRQGSNENTEQQ